MNSTTSQPWANPTDPTARPARVRGLVLCRESDERDDEQFDGVREQTYQQQRHVPALEAVRQLGMSPMEGHDHVVVTETLSDGSVREQRVFIETLHEGRTRAILFCYEGYWHLWSQSSAAKMTDDGVNDFTQILVKVILRLRPFTLYALNISRLIRSQRQASVLQTAMFDNVDSIVAGSFEFALTGPNAGVGIVLLTTLAMASAIERDAIVQRTSAGRIAKWRRGEWPFGVSTVPFGYVCNRSGRLEVVDSLRPMVRQMLLVLAGDAPPAEMRRQLSRAGVLTMRKHRSYGRQVNVEALSNPSQLITRLYAWAAVWSEGEFLFRLGNSFPGIETLNGLPVMRHHPGDRGEFQMLSVVPVPEGGWAEPKVLRAFQVKAREHSQALLQLGRTPVRPLSATVEQSSNNAQLHAGLLNPQRAAGNDRDSQTRRDGARAKRTVAPLAGRRWSVDDWQYELQVVQSGRYRLFRWPASLRRGTLRPSITPASLPLSDGSAS